MFKRIKPFTKNEHIKIRPVVCLIVGKRGSGRSTLAKDLAMFLSKRDNTHCINVLCKEDSRSFWNENDNQTPIHFEESLHTAQQNSGSHKEIKKITVIDDQENILAFPTEAETISIIQLFYNSKLYNTSIIFICDNILTISNKLRDSIDYLFVFDTNKIHTIRRYQMYMGTKLSFYHFKKIFHHSTRNHGTLVIDMTKYCDDVSERLYYYNSLIYSKHDSTYIIHHSLHKI